MRLSELSSEQYLRYFEIRLQGRLRKSGSGFMAKCIWHEDRTASMSVNVDKGVWNCHAGCGSGGVLDFEKKFLGGSDADALARISELLGEKQLAMGGGKAERIYQYQDAYGRVLFEKLRYPGKRFTQRQVIDAHKGQYEYKLAPGLKPLYHLPEVLTSDQVFVAEGEKDCDNIRAMFPRNGQTVTATTNFDGAGKWRDEYGPYFMGKRVVIFSDNDEVGEKHAEMVARCTHRYAAGVKLITFPELAPKSDVSDFIQQNGEDAKRLLMERVKATPLWRPPEQDQSYFMPVDKFVKLAPRAMEWVIRGLIQKGTNGIMISRPKSAKSFLTLDLAVALASGQSWLNFDVPMVKRIGVVSREDYGVATSWRVDRLCEGRGIHPSDLAEMLFVNTKLQLPTFSLGNDADVQELMRQIEARQLEFLIMDVLRVLHSSDENDNTEMQKIIERLNQIQSKTGAQILVIHHTNKGKDLMLTEQSRGAGAVAGWAEYMMGLSVVDEDEQFPIREVRFETKAGNTPKPRYFKIVDLHTATCTTPDDCSCPRRIDAVNYQCEHKRERRRGAEVGHGNGNGNELFTGR